MKTLQTRAFALAALVLSAAALPVQAAPIDVTAVVTGIGEQITPINLVGAAVLLIVVALASWRWVRRGVN